MRMCHRARPPPAAAQCADPAPRGRALRVIKDVRSYGGGKLPNQVLLWSQHNSKPHVSSHRFRLTPKTRATLAKSWLAAGTACACAPARLVFLRTTRILGARSVARARKLVLITLIGGKQPVRSNTPKFHESALVAKDTGSLWCSS